MVDPNPVQHFNLRWNNHTNNIIQVFAEQLNSESLVDVTLSCQGQFLKAHKMVLSACSPYFQELFRVHQVPHPLIIINGMTFLDVKLVIDFMYHGEVKVQEGHLGGLLLAAETLQVKGLANVRNKYESGQIGCSGADRCGDDKASQPTHVESMDEGSTTNDELAKDSDPPTQSESSQNPTQEFDDDLPATIKVEPPDIRDIDEEPATGWDSPRLIIDMKSDSKEPTEINPLKRLELGPKRPNILRPVTSIRVATAHLELSDDDTQTSKSDTATISTNSPSKCILWPRRAQRVGGKVISNWGKPKICKIPRPPNAFMIFANVWRRKLAVEHPSESNKDISIRLGTMWKNLDADAKEIYYSQARKADEEHKVKYPGYYYSPKEARMRKGLKQRGISAGTPHPSMDALRFVKVFMTNAEKSQLLIQNEASSLLRKPMLQQSTGHNALESESDSLNDSMETDEIPEATPELNSEETEIVHDDQSESSLLLEKQNEAVLAD